MKKIKITLKDLFNLPTANLFNANLYKPVSSVVIDSRIAKTKSLFIAIKGKNFDGHDFVNEAVKNGASAVVIDEKQLKRFENLLIPFVTVKDTTNALGQLAVAWRNKLNAKVIAITGSNGKTTTKDIIKTLLKKKFKVTSTLANNNNDIGVPLTLFSADAKDEIVVLELGSNHFGEIALTSSFTQPEYAIITNVGASHLEFLKNLEGVKKEKEALLKVTEKNKGVIFINNDDVMLRSLKKKYSKVITYGFNDKSDVKGKILGIKPDGRSVLKISYKDKKFSFTIPLYGKENAQNVLAACAVALKLGLSKNQIIAGIKKLEPVKHRLNVTEYKNIFLIDDTYNANPNSMKSALELVGEINLHKNKVVILGDMMELGSNTAEMHRDLAKDIEKNKINTVLTIGTAMQYLFDVLQNSKIYSVQFTDRNSLSKFLTEFDLSDSVVLVKGSRGMKMEEFVQTIKERFIN